MGCLIGPLLAEMGHSHMRNSPLAYGFGSVRTTRCRRAGTVHGRRIKNITYAGRTRGDLQKDNGSVAGVGQELSNMWQQSLVGRCPRGAADYYYQRAYRTVRRDKLPAGHAHFCAMRLHHVFQCGRIGCLAAEDRRASWKTRWLTALHKQQNRPPLQNRREEQQFALRMWGEK